MTPQSIGLTGSTLSIGKLSGRRGLAGKLAELGYELGSEALDAVYRDAIALADAKKEVTDDDLIALVEQHVAESREGAATPRAVQLDGWNVTSSHGGRSQGSVSVTLDGESRTADSSGNGPVDALFRAVDAAVEPVLGWRPLLTEYEIRAVSGGEDAQGRVLVRARRSNAASVVTGHGLSTNIIEASLEGYLGALTKLLGDEHASAGVDAAGPAEVSVP
jgi:2-isopropylmalate synthase